MKSVFKSMTRLRFRSIVYYNILLNSIFEPILYIILLYPIKICEIIHFILCSQTYANRRPKNKYRMEKNNDNIEKGEKRHFVVLNSRQTIR